MAKANLGKVMGSRILFIRTESPGAELGILDDWAINTDSGKLWEKLSTGWEYRGSIKVPAVDIPGIMKWNLDVNHPVGSWWLSDLPTNPHDIFGGEWEQLKGRFLLAADESHAAGSTGGAFKITQTAAQVAPHAHVSGDSSTNGTIGLSGGGPQSGFQLQFGPLSNRTDLNISTSSAGGGEPMDITNPYHATYVWRRIA